MNGPVGIGFLRVAPGSLGVPMPGYNIQMLYDAGHQVNCNELGNIIRRLSLQPPELPALWNAKEPLSEVYLSNFPGYYAVAEAGMINYYGYVFIMVSTNGIVNVVRRKRSTSAGVDNGRQAISTAA